MATGGETYKPGTREWYEAMKAKQAATAERKAKASFKQLVCWRKFRISGAAGFADGALRSAANRLAALVDELPQEGSSCKLEVRKGIATINMLIAQLRGWRMDAMEQAERAEEQASGTTNSGSA